MPRTSSISKEKRQQLSELFIKGTRTADAATAVDVSFNMAHYFRTKLVSAGVIERKRTRRTKATTTAITTAKPVATTQSSLSTQDLSSVVGDSFVFRINNMDIKISDAKKVHVQKGMIEIKY